MNRYRSVSAATLLKIIACMLWLFAASLLAEHVVARDEQPYRPNRRDKLFCSHFIDRQVGIVVGSKGLILKTTDRGTSWQRIDTGIREPLNTVTFVGTEGWIAGGGGIVLHSADQGMSWARQETGVSESLMAAHFFDCRRGIIVGAAGTILTTADGGATWKRHPFDWGANLPECAIDKCIVSPSLYAVYFADEQHGWIVGEKGTVMATNNGGNAWMLREVGNYPSLYGVYFRDEREGIAVGKDWTFLTTTDGGTTWRQKELPPSPMGAVDLNDIAIRGKDGVIVGDRGLVLVSDDGGRQWQPSAELMKPPLPFLVSTCLLPENSPHEACIVGAGTIALVPMK